MRAPGGPPGGPARPPAGRASGPGPRGREEPGARQPVREAYLATHGLEKSFGGRKVVRGTSVYVRRGEAVGLLGPNGAGKTTVFYMITGLIKPDRGRVELDGFDVTRLPMYQRARLGIGYLPQEASIFRGLSVEENIRAVLEVTEPNRRRREADLDGLLAEFGLTKLRKSPTIALSGGERRRCEIARALATRPNYMLLDEPFAGIDPIAVGDIKTLVPRTTLRPLKLFSRPWVARYASRTGCRAPGSSRPRGPGPGARPAGGRAGPPGGPPGARMSRPSAGIGLCAGGGSGLCSSL